MNTNTIRSLSAVFTFLIITSQILIAEYTADLTTSSTISASSEKKSRTYGAVLAINDDLSDRWISKDLTIAEPQWLQFDFGAGTKKQIQKYVMHGNGGSGREPKTWQFQASNDPTNWIDLHTQSENITSEGQNSRAFEIVNLNSYQYYRLYITDVNSSYEKKEAHSSEFELMELVEEALGGGLPSEPKINITSSGVEIANGDTTPDSGDDTDFGLRHVPDDSVTRTFFVKNTGTAELILNSPGVSLSGSSDFKVVDQPSSLTVAAGDSQSFTVRYSPTTADTADATISIAHNADDSPYTFAVQGRGGVEKLQVTGAEVLVNGDTYPTISKGTHFGSVFVNGGKDTLSFTFKNTGNWPLTFSFPDFSNMTTFTPLTEGFVKMLQPDSSTTAKVVFDPNDDGPDSTLIGLSTTDPSSPFKMLLKGEGSWLGVVSATVFCDNNANGAMDDGEAGLKDIVVTLNQKGDKVEYSKAKTNGSGQVKFDNLDGGEYTVIIDETTLPEGGASTTGSATATVTLDKNSQVSAVKFGYFYADSAATKEHNNNSDLPWNLPLVYEAGSPSHAKEPWSNAVDGVLYGWGGTATVKGDENGDVWAVFKVDGGPCQFDRMTIIADNGQDDNGSERRQITKVQILASVTGSSSADFSPIAELTLDDEDNVYEFKSTHIASYIKVLVKAPLYSPETWRQIVEIALGEVQQHFAKKDAELESVEVPTEFSLSQNYPNPFNPTTSISYTLPDAQNVDIGVYNIKGGRVKQLVSGHQDAGQFSIGWDATNAAGNKVTTGVYFYRINAGEFHDTKKMTLMQ
jgi:hypothetical protein